MHFSTSIAFFTLLNIVASFPLTTLPLPNERNLLARTAPLNLERSVPEIGSESGRPDTRRGILDKLKDLGDSVKQEADAALERAKKAAQEAAEHAKKEAEDAAQRLKDELEKIKEVTQPIVDIATRNNNKDNASTT